MAKTKREFHRLVQQFRVTSLTRFRKVLEGCTKEEEAALHEAEMNAHDEMLEQLKSEFIHGASSSGATDTTQN
jgi:hypothetical protein